MWQVRRSIIFALHSAEKGGGIELAILSDRHFFAPVVLPPPQPDPPRRARRRLPRLRRRSSYCRLLKWHFYKRANLRLKSVKKINVTNVLLLYIRSDKARREEEERNRDFRDRFRRFGQSTRTAPKDFSISTRRRTKITSLSFANRFIGLGWGPPHDFLRSQPSIYRPRSGEVGKNR